MYPWRTWNLPFGRNQSKHLLGEAAYHLAEGKIVKESFFSGRRKIGYQVDYAGENGVTLTFEKQVVIYTSRDLKSQEASAIEKIWQAVIKGFCGVQVKDDLLMLSPSLPKHWKNVSFRFMFNLVPLKLKITKEKIGLQVLAEQFRPIDVQLFDKIVTLDQTTPSFTWKVK